MRGRPPPSPRASRAGAPRAGSSVGLGRAHPLSDRWAATTLHADSAVGPGLSRDGPRRLSSQRLSNYWVSSTPLLPRRCRGVYPRPGRRGATRAPGSSLPARRASRDVPRPTPARPGSGVRAILPTLPSSPTERLRSRWGSRSSSRRPDPFGPCGDRV